MSRTEHYGDNHWIAQEFKWNPDKLVATQKAPPSPEKEEVASAARMSPMLKPKTSKESDTVVCQIDGCSNHCDAHYYKKYKICREHGKAPAVNINGNLVRFCQKVTFACTCFERNWFI